MEPQIVQHLPWVIAAGAVTVSGIITVVKGYRWFIAEIRAALDNEQKERP